MNEQANSSNIEKEEEIVHLIIQHSLMVGLVASNIVLEILIVLSIVL